MKLEMKIKSPKFFFKIKKGRIEIGSLTFWNLVARIIERDRKK